MSILFCLGITNFKDNLAMAYGELVGSKVLDIIDFSFIGLSHLMDIQLDPRFKILILLFSTRFKNIHIYF